MTRTLIGLLSVWVLASSCATNPNASAPPVPAESAEVALVHLGGVEIDTVKRMISVAGRVNQVEGPIELLVCGPGGKTHESIFVVDEPPQNLQAAVLLLGVEPGVGPVDLGVGPLSGPAFEIWVEWGDTDGVSRNRAESMIFNYRTKKDLSDVHWIFSGSEVIDGKFKADAFGGFVATYWDPWAIFNIGLDLGADDEALLIQTNTVPPYAAPVQLQFQLVD